MRVRDKACTVAGCGSPQKGRGLCNKHLIRLRKTGTTEARPRMTTAERLAEQSELRESGCIEWTGRLDRYGYGYIDEWRGNRRVARIKAHRAAVIVSGRILHPEAVVMHTCDNPPCVNPAHLVVATQADNIHDAIRKGRHRPPVKQPIKHGTVGGYNAHRRRGQSACTACRDAMRQQSAERRRARRGEAA